MANGLYLPTFEAALENTKAIDLAGDTFKMALVTSSYTADFDAHDEWADVSANEASGTGYTAGGQALTTVTFSGSSGTLTFDCDDVSWTSSTISSAAAAVIYDDTVAGDPLLVYLDFGGTFSTGGSSTFKVTIPASGVFTLDLTP